MTTRRALAVLFLAAASGCALRAAGDGRAAGGGRVADAAAPSRSAFEVYPAEQVAQVRNPHDYNGKALCQRCHAPDLTLTKGANALCGECHVFHQGNHPVDVVQAGPAPGLPLLAGGKVACHTCHDPHQNKRVLRTNFEHLCKTCHKGH